MERKFLPTFSELIDRLSIHQLKEVFLPENKKKYEEEMKMIEQDLDLIIKSKKIQVTADLIRAIVVLSQINAHIWNNESKARKGEDQSCVLLRLTHGLNGIRNKACNFILELIGDEGRKDLKTDCLADEFKDWEISLFNKKESKS